jgi:hypothetical protein
VLTGPCVNTFGRDVHVVDNAKQGKELSILISLIDESLVLRLTSSETAKVAVGTESNSLEGRNDVTHILISLPMPMSIREPSSHMTSHFTVID